jgi:hypothetical protein
MTYGMSAKNEREVVQRVPAACVATLVLFFVRFAVIGLMRIF